MPVPSRGIADGMWTYHCDRELGVLLSLTAPLRLLRPQCFINPQAAQDAFLANLVLISTENIFLLYLETVSHQPKSFPFKGKPQCGRHTLHLIPTGQLKSFNVICLILNYVYDMCYEIRINVIVPQDGFCTPTSCIAGKMRPWCNHH